MKITFVKSVPKNIPVVRLTDSNESETLVLENGTRQINIGIGKRSEMTRRKFMLLGRRVIAAAKHAKVKKVAIDLNDFAFPQFDMGESEITEILGVNLQLGNFEFVKYKTKPKEGWNFVEEIIVNYGGSTSIVEGLKSGFERGLMIGEEINKCRALSNTPGGEMTPQLLANAARAAAAGTKAKVKVLGLKEIQKLKMGGLLGVASGSDEEPRFIIVEYWGAGRGKKPFDPFDELRVVLRDSKDDKAQGKPIVLVGKGITFDTGGLNLKPSNSIYEMHMDMSGGAAVIHAVILAAKLGLKKNIIALVPAAENMPSGSSYRPGDVLRTMSGKTIEVMDTDAEGRVILSDALTYAERYKPELVVDVATLTGSAMAALGTKMSALFTKDDKLAEKFERLGEESGDYVWQLPLWDEYESDIKGTFGDWANLGKTKYGGAITGAMFLYQFAKNYPWVHLDIAPRMTSAEGDYLAKGAAGEPIRLLLKLLEK